jgi:hypothetical protein
MTWNLYSSGDNPKGVEIQLLEEPHNLYFRDHALGPETSRKV